MVTSRTTSRMTAYACLIALTIGVFTGPVRAGTPDVAAHNESIVQQAFDNWSKGGNVFAELLAPNVKWTIHGSGPVAGTYTNMEDFIERAAVPLVSRLRGPVVPKVHGIWAVDDTVIIRFDGSATTTSGAPYANQFVWIFRMADGRVAEAEAFLDLAAYQRVVENNTPRAN